ncbi:prepilin-type N-terminal cleavage/methylation domain-containing protein [Candidatus Parcubacteria bacterium]|nr:prepilin-type N-terminal cleavage/methylation domain-containing protein [Candidatus Parcubacteria bacterium]
MTKKEQGFTLIELLVVISIMSLLSSVVFASLQTARNKAYAAAILLNYNAVKQATAAWQLDTNNTLLPYQGDFPVSNYCGSAGAAPWLSNTHLYTTAYTSGNYNRGWTGPYLSAVPRTPFGLEYLYDNDWDHRTKSGTQSGGANLLVVWCTAGEKTKGVAIAEELDRRIDRNDGDSAGAVRWNPGTTVGKLWLFLDPNDECLKYPATLVCP